MSSSSDARVFLILSVTKSFAEIIIELEGAKGTAINLFIVGLFCDLSFSNILTASIDGKFFNLTIDIFAELFISKSFNKFLILLILLALSTINIELMDAILDR